jgi:hypothetical protein
MICILIVMITRNVLFFVVVMCLTPLTLTVPVHSSSPGPVISFLEVQPTSSDSDFRRDLIKNKNKSWTLKYIKFTATPTQDTKIYARAAESNTRNQDVYPRKGVSAVP